MVVMKQDLLLCKVQGAVINDMPKSSASIDTRCCARTQATVIAQYKTGDITKEHNTS
jgi:hypothetical protein